MTKIKPKPDADEPAKKKKKSKKGQGSATLFIVGGVAIFVVLLAVAGVSAYFLTRREPLADAKPNLQAKVEDKEKKKDPGGEPAAPDKDKKGEKEKKEKADPGAGIRIAPKINEGNPNRKGGVYVVRTIRGAVYRTERQSELRQLAIEFNSFQGVYKGKGTHENFLEAINTFGPIRDSVNEGYYQVNLMARLSSDNIIAFERDGDETKGHLCVRANGDISTVSAAQLKKELNIPD